MELITTLSKIKNKICTTADARCRAIGLIEGLCRYKTILIAKMYLWIFQKTTPLSKYLQGHVVNMITSYQTVQMTLEELKINARDFSSM